jgi:hypothetical protein
MKNHAYFHIFTLLQILSCNRDGHGATAVLRLRVCISFQGKPKSSIMHLPREAYGAKSSDEPRRSSMVHVFQYFNSGFFEIVFRWSYSFTMYRNYVTTSSPSITIN